MLWLAILYPTVIFALPKFNKVNDFDLSGKPCIGPTLSVDCPVLCVQDHNDCPTNYSHCPAQYRLCNDGNCYSVNNTKVDGCAEVKNVCSCHGSSYKPCKMLATLNMENYHKDTVTARCLDHYNTSHTLNNTNHLLLECPTIKTIHVLTGSEPLFIILYTMWFLFGVLNIIWYYMKQNIEAPFKAIKQSSNNFSVNEYQKLEVYQTKKSFQHGYMDHLFGNFLFVLLILLSISWQLCLFLICLNYYEIFFKHTYDNLVVSLIGVWFSSTAWYTFLKIKEDSLRNWYRVRTNFTECTKLQIWNQDESKVFTPYQSKLMQWFSAMLSYSKKIFGLHGTYLTVPIEETPKKTRYFDYRNCRHIFIKEKNIFEAINIEVSSTNGGFLQKMQGLTSDEANNIIDVIGYNFISVNVSSIAAALFQEFTSPFYIYQLCILWIWFYWNYYNMGLVTTSVIVISGLIKTIIKRRSELKIKDMSEQISNVTVMRGGHWITVSSKLLIPGDLLSIKTDDIMQCDVVLVSGTVAMDESMLTGESKPVQKFPVTNDEQLFRKMGHSKKSVLFSGTQVLQAQSSIDEDKVLVVVEAIGAKSEKGKLVTSILFRSKVNFIFDQHLKVVFFILFIWALCVMIWIVWINDKAGAGTFLISIFVCAQVLSPLLPSVLIIGQSVAADRLRKAGIYCVDLHRITISGKVCIFCFDKTGTLTKQGLEFHGVQPIHEGISGHLITDAKKLPDLLQTAIGSAHTITKIESRYVGNPVDVEMFRVGGWDLNKNIISNSHRSLRILKRFEFVHSRMSMSVAVEDMESKEIHIFVKGSFEKIQELSDPTSIPKDFNEITQQFTAKGCYTLGLAHRSLGMVSPDTIKTMNRNEFEKGCSYIGLLLFRNNLKEDSKEAMQLLKEGNVRPVMITGDNVMTGIFIANECGMIEQESTIILADIPSIIYKSAERKAEGKIRRKSSGCTPRDLVWKNMKTGQVVNMVDYLYDSIEYNTLSTNFPKKKNSINNSSFSYKKLNNNDLKSVLLSKQDSHSTRTNLDNLSKEGPVELALTGKAFNVLYQHNIMPQILLKCRIFARMAPQDKVRCVQLHMAKEITGMCGDGGNDCGALRTAHIGLAMSEAEASIVSPFSTKNPSPLSAVRLLREGRAALATSFSSYRYLIMYGETIVMSKIIFSYFAVNLSQWVWIISDGIFVTCLSYALSLSKPSDHLASRHPTARLLGGETLISTLGVILINTMFSVFGIVLLFNQSFFVCKEFNANTIDITKWWLLADNYEAETLGFMVLFQIFTAAAIGNFGSHYRQQWYKNYLFATFFLISIIGTSAILLSDPNPVGCWFRFNCGDPERLQAYFNSTSAFTWTGNKYNNPWGNNIYPREFRIVLFFYCLMNSAIVVIYQRFFVLGPIREWARKKWPRNKRLFTV